MGRSTEEALAASKERVEGLWDDEGEESPSTAEAPEESPGRVESSAEIRETLERATRALDAAPAEDQEEMIDLIEDLHVALKEGRAEDAVTIRQNLDEILITMICRST